MTRLAGLPMYDFAEIKSATDSLWQILRDDLMRRGLNDVPLTLTRPNDLPAFWSDASLLIGQTCGYPFTHGLCGTARYVATPCYTTAFSSGPLHKSLIIVHRDSEIRTLSDANGKICAINMADSNTGMNLLRLEIAKLKPQGTFFARVYETLAHRKSIQAVAHGEADIASIDCVTFAHIDLIEPMLTAQLRILAETEETPSLPFITSADTDDETLDLLRASLAHVITDPAHHAVMAKLLLNGVEILQPDAYQRVQAIEDQAIALGYPELV